MASGLENEFVTLHEIVKAAKAVVLVTHDMGWVTEYCNRAVLIEKGRVVMEGDPAEVVAVQPQLVDQVFSTQDVMSVGNWQSGP